MDAHAAAMTRTVVIAAAAVAFHAAQGQILLATDTPLVNAGGPGLIIIHESTDAELAPSVLAAVRRWPAQEARRARLIDALFPAPDDGAEDDFDIPL